MIKKRFAYILITLFSGLLLALSGITLAWFFNTTADINITADGEIFTNYFHCGNGSEDEPYVITRPVHLYNLTKLYEELPDFASSNHHFQLGYDLENNGNLEFYSYNDAGVQQSGYSDSLNMNYYENFVPIGSEIKPFGGTFDGSSLTINNLNISGSGISDIGVFGYVTKDAEIKDLYINNLEIDITDAVDDEHNHSNAYVGYIAGHIDDATCFTNTYVNNCEITGNSVLTKNDWGYFGYCKNAASIQAFIDKAKEGQGEASTWGGSIAFDAFNQRLYHHISSASNIRFKNGNSTYTNGLIRTESDSDSAITVYRGGNASTAATYLSQDPANNYVVYNMIGAGTHSINNKQNNSGTTYTATSAVNGTYEPLIIDSDYTVADRNTGYLTSSQYTQNGSSHYYNAIDGTVRSASYPNGQIANSLDDSYHNQSSLYNGSTGGPKFTYDGSKLEILTNSSASYGASNYRLISDDYNSGHTVSNSALTGYTKTNYDTLGLKRYKSARAHLEQVLSGSQYVHGIHFMGEAPAANKTVNVPHAVINGEVNSNYPVLLSTVDFVVQEEGYITLFAGAYYPATQTTIADSFFDLYKVNRNANGGIASIQKVYKIYKDSNNNYTYTSSANQTVSGATLMFDMSYLTSQPPKNNVAYYFEIPVDAGEFAIGAVSGKTAGAYLMYLDLGTNGGEGQEETLVDDFGSVEYRTTPDTVEHNIVLITYIQQASQTNTLSVVYIESEKRYNISYSGTLTQIIVTVLNTDYYVYFNGTLLLQEIQSNYLN